MQKYLFHTTPTENVEKIIKEGLKLNPDGRKRCFIYLSEFPTSWVDKDNSTNISILQVDVSDIDFYHTETYWRPEIDEIMFTQEIPPITKDGKQRFKDMTSTYIDLTRSNNV